jgi:hypothetical protein
MNQDVIKELMEKSMRLEKLTRNLLAETQNFRALHRMRMAAEADAKRAELILLFESYLDNVVELERDIGEVSS